MKKLIVAILMLALLLPAAALADLPDISGLSHEELLELRDAVSIELKKYEADQRITLDPGIWAIGKDIPSGRWLITPADDQYMNLWYGDVLNESGTNAGYGWDSVNGYNKTMSTKKKKDGSWKDPDYPHSVIINMKEGWYLNNAGTITLTPAED